jgi:predicted alpha/beta superfamily hydrolase
MSHRLRRRLDRIVEQMRLPSAFSRRKPRFPGELRRIPRFDSRFLNHARDVLVYLPPGYNDDVSRRYPVLYMHDGQNLFDPRTSFIRGQHWRMGETVGAMINDRIIEPLIVVGIHNAGEKRIDEYTPTRDPERHRGGHADRYGRMILHELKPRIDRDFRTLPDAQSTALAGSSLGGLVSLYLGLTNAQAFGRLGVLSPSVWWDDKVIIHAVQAFNGERKPRIWLDIGTGEGLEAVSNARQLAEVLLAKGWHPEENFKYVEVPGAGHNEVAWAHRIGDVMRFLFHK